MTWLTRLLSKKANLPTAVGADGGVLRELDCVALLEDVGLQSSIGESEAFASTVPAGTEGTIVSVLSSDHVLVEFCRGMRSTLLEINTSKIRPISSIAKKIEHA